MKILVFLIMITSVNIYAKVVMKCEVTQYWGNPSFNYSIGTVEYRNINNFDIHKAKPNYVRVMAKDRRNNRAGIGNLKILVEMNRDRINMTNSEIDTFIDLYRVGHRVYEGRAVIDQDFAYSVICRDIKTRNGSVY